MYEAEIARFLSEDPAQSEPNLYRYAGNSPLNAVDPSGLDSIRVEKPDQIGGLVRWNLDAGNCGSVVIGTVAEVPVKGTNAVTWVRLDPAYGGIRVSLKALREYASDHSIDCSQTAEAKNSQLQNLLKSGAAPQTKRKVLPSIPAWLLELLCPVCPKSACEDQFTNVFEVHGQALRRVIEKYRGGGKVSIQEIFGPLESLLSELEREIENCPGYTQEKSEGRRVRWAQRRR